MPSFDSNDRFEGQNRPLDSANENLVAEQDLLMEQILENINTTPIGQVLKKIATLPEVRREKVLDLRQRLSKGKYKVNERLDIVLDKVLEDLTT
jgi:anti-sigma28 factor (negative regulator of flagellin synthesis)